MGKLLDDLRADDTKPGYGCTFCTWLRSRSPEEQAEWAEAEADPLLSSSVLYRGAKDRGYRYRDQPVRDHRREKHDPHARR